jgi:hypothetical protein
MKRSCMFDQVISLWDGKLDRLGRSLKDLIETLHVESILSACAA